MWSIMAADPDGIRGSTPLHRSDLKAWPSVHAHLAGKDDAVTAVAPVLSRVGDFEAFLAIDRDDEDFAPLRLGESVGRPMGGTDFLTDLEKRFDRPLLPQNAGQNPRMGARILDKHIDCINYVTVTVIRVTGLRDIFSGASA